MLKFLHSTSTPKRTTHQPVSSTRRAQPALPRCHTSHDISTSRKKLVSTTPPSHIDTDWVASCQEAPSGLIRQQSSSRKRRQAHRRVYDKPGKKPAALYEPDLPRLQGAIQITRRTRLGYRLDSFYERSDSGRSQPYPI